MKTILVPGEKSEGSNLETAESLGRVELSATRSRKAEPIEVQDNDVVALEYEDGFTRFIRVDQLAEEGFVARTRSGGKELILETSLLDSRTRSRGLLLKAAEFFRNPVKTLEEFVIDRIADEGKNTLGQLAARRICSKKEDKLVPRTGLFKVNTSKLDKPWINDSSEKLKNPKNPNQPILLMIHGTASSTDAAFVGLRSEHRQESWAEFVKKNYEDRLWAFNHKTLTESPLSNACSLLESLPANTDLHIVSHSRGGLIGELLCLDPGKLDQLDEDLFAGPQHRDYIRFVELLKEKSPQVSRFLRVACPALGTTLASGRLDRYLNGLFNAIEYLVTGGKYIALGQGLIPLYNLGNVLGNCLDVLKECIVVLTSQRADVDVLPGLEAMMPTSALIRLLNREGRTTKADLAVIAGDVKSVGGESRRFTNLAGDLFYLEEHDWVVHTRAMYGGIEREKAVKFLCQAAAANHFRYFINADTFEALCDGLQGRRAQYGPIEKPELDDPNWWERFRFVLSRDGAKEDKRPIVFILPGILGSHLYVDGVASWLSPGAISEGSFVEKLAFGKHDVEAVGVMHRYYAGLAEFLSATHRVVIFPFDWRLPISTLGELLAAKVDKELKEGDEERVRFLCHSMGGLVVRAFMTSASWRRIKSRVDRIVMLGVPNKGSYKALQMLLGQGGWLNPVNLLAAGDRVYKKDDIIRTICGFPGMLNLLPPELLPARRWERVVSSHPSLAQVNLNHLQEIEEFWENVSLSVDPSRMVYIAGKASSTPVDFDGDFDETHEGDGTVPWERGQLPGVTMYYTDADHGNLPRHKDAFAAYLELLTKGTTKSRIVSLDKPKRGWWIFRDGSNASRQTEVKTPDGMPLVYPELRDYEAAALGAISRPGNDSELPDADFKVEVSHGDLVYASHPVVLGHYAKQPLEGTERALDSRLQNRLSRDRAYGVYPDLLGTSRQFLEINPNTGDFDGGIVVGLGQFGTLTPGGLTSAVAQSVLDFLLRRADSDIRDEKEVALSFVSIGSREGGIGLAESLSCILNGVKQANQALTLKDADTKPLARVEFVELFLERAIDTAHELQRLAGTASFSGGFQVEPHLKSIGGGLRSIRGYDGRTDWQRIDISELDRSLDPRASSRSRYLRFKPLTDRAHNPETDLEMDRQLIHTFVKEASQRHDWDAELSHTLFELLIPLGLKEFAADGKNLLLQVTEETAGLPWEMLMDGLDGCEPISVRGSMIRQLSSLSEKARPLAALERSVLVVGDPPSKNFAELPSAQDEAVKVAAALRANHFEVECMVRPNGTDVIKKLMAKPHRILHLSGHGVYEDLPSQKPRSGMVLGDELLLTPAIFGQIRICPELVFLNCCHLGRIDSSETFFPRLAASLATEVIRSGAKAVIAAGWAVEDQSAEIFALQFYRSMLAGRQFGEAVLEARRATFAQRPQFNSWGAFQAYGDPEYTFRLARHRGGTSHTRRFVSPSEVVIDLENLESQAKVSALQDFSYLGERAESILEAIPKEWLTPHTKHPEVLIALARAHSQLIHPLFGITHREHDPHLEIALSFYLDSKAQSFLTVDDLSICLRLELLKEIYKEYPDYQEIKKIIELRKTLVKQSSNPKAWSRVGGAAMTALSVRHLPDSAVQDLLNIMELEYKRSLAENPKNEYYRDYAFLPKLCRSWGKGALKESDLLELRPIELAGNNFFEILTGARRTLLLWLARGGSRQELETVEGSLRTAWNRGASPFQFKSLLELLEFLVTMRERVEDGEGSVLSDLEQLRSLALRAVGWDGTAAEEPRLSPSHPHQIFKNAVAFAPDPIVKGEPFQLALQVDTEAPLAYPTEETTPVSPPQEPLSFVLRYDFEGFDLETNEKVVSQAELQRGVSTKFTAPTKLEVGVHFGSILVSRIVVVNEYEERMLVPLLEIPVSLRLVAGASDAQVENRVCVGLGRPIRRLFASHSSADRVQVLEYARAAEAFGSQVFVDCLDIKNGELWDERIKEEILACDRFLLFWSQASKDSRWVEKEWRFALQERGPKRMSAISAVEADAVSLPSQLAKLHFSEYCRSNEAAVSGDPQ